MPGQIWGAGGGTGPILSQIEIIQMACTDLATVITPVVGTGFFRVAKSFTLTEVRAALWVASSSGVVTVDINKNGVSVLSTKLTIDANEKSSISAAIPYVISNALLEDDAEISVDIDTAGASARGLVVSLLGVYN